MERFIKISVLLLVNSVFPIITLAQTPNLLSDRETTPDINILPPITAAITLETIAFKNDPDILTFRVHGTSGTINLKGLSFYDDKDFKTVTEDFPVSSDSVVSLTFNSSLPDDPENLKLYTSKTGLTATTEQILIHSGAQQFDFFCWYKSPVAKSEIADFEKIRPDAYWDENDIESCFESGQIKNGQTLKKVTNEPNSSSWEIIIPASPAPASSSSAAESKTPAPAKDSLSEIIAGQDNIIDDPPLRITEIYPLPKNKEEHEWMEILNVSDTPVNLTGWIVDDAEAGSKPKRLTADSLSKNVIAPGQVTQIDFTKLKITLNNDADSIRIFLPDGQPVDQQDYGDGKKGQSYALITLDDEENWIWTDHPTPGTNNPQLQTVSGTIVSAPEFKSTYFFSISEKPAGNENISGQKTLITFDESVVKGPLARQLFTVGNSGVFSGEISPAQENTNDYGQIMKLYNYEITGQSENNSLSPELLIIVTIGALGIILFFLLPKIFPQWKLSTSDKSS